ncbi:MAG TPA: twin-arginine translocase TatA/TatE family subunit [Edaphobacter sp.]|jgi:sec-independent protein translocase protein TatB|nr:twin-arginine translocase TatA/TatE family subunit [Edaphobacter sp.]
MPSFQDSAILVILALILFGPKKLPELARQLGKLMAEFRRASNEFRMQMEEELRIADQEEQRKKIAAMEAAAPVAPAIISDKSDAVAVNDEFLVGHPHEQPQSETTAETKPDPLPIASSGDLHLMPPETGLPVSNSTLSPVLDSIPHDPDPETASAETVPSEAAQRG